MKKKLLAVLLVVVMAMTLLPMAAFAADGPTATAVLTDKDKVVAITVKVGSEEFTGGGAAGKGGSTTTYLVDGYVVEIILANNGKSITSCKILASEVSAPFPNNGGSQGGTVPNNFGDSTAPNEDDGSYTNKDYNNAQFHCNADGNGRVWTTLGKNITQKWSSPLNFVKTDARSPQNPSNGKDTMWSLVNDIPFICEVCGSREWVTFSNNSGKPDGKNIQMNHPGQETKVTKEWIINNDYPDDYQYIATFEYYYIDADGCEFGPFTVTLRGPRDSSTSIFIPSDLTVKIRELSKPNFDLAGVWVNGELADPDENGFVILKGGDAIKFANEDEPGGEEFGFSFEKKVRVGDEDISIVDWLCQKFDFDITDPDDALALMDILEGMKFDLYKVDSDKGELPDEPVYTGALLDLTSKVTFGNLKELGWYAIVENFTEEAAQLWKAPPVWYVLVTEDGALLSLNGIEEGSVGGGGFDYDAKYTIINGYGGGYTLGYPGLNNSGDIFPIGVRNSVTGDEYASFCANAGSTNFDEGDGRYVVAAAFKDVHDRNQEGIVNGKDYADFLSAYNYIEDTYGNLNAVRPITQIITWYLLSAINEDNLDIINWDAVMAGTSSVPGVVNARSIVEDVIASYKDYKGNGTIIDIVYMVSELNPNFVTAQPQLVPLYKTGYIVNKPDEGTEKGVISVTVGFELFEEWIEQTHKPVYKHIENSEKTLTLRGDFFDNNLNFVQLGANDFFAYGYKGEVAVSHNNSGKDPGTGIWFFATVDGVTFFDGEYGLEIDAISDYSLLLYSNLGGHNINSENKHGNKVYNFYEDGDVLYLLFHNSGGFSGYTEEVVGCALDQSPSDSGFTPLDIGDYIELYSELLEKTAFSIGEDGVKKQANLAGTAEFTDLAPGEYTIVLWFDGNIVSEEILTVVDETPIAHAFDNIKYVTNEGNPVQIVVCPIDCGI